MRYSTKLKESEIQKDFLEVWKRIEETILLLKQSTEIQKSLSMKSVALEILSNKIDLHKEPEKRIM